MFSDLQYALRGILRRPGHTALVVCTLALGLGVNTVAFSSVNALIFRAGTFEQGDTYGWIFVSEGDNPYATTSRDTYDALRTHATTLEDVVAEGRLPLSASTDAGPEQVWALAVSPNYFTVVHASVRAGRVLSPSDATTGAIPILISERHWHARWRATPDLTSIRPILNGQLTNVVGVVRDDYQGPGGLFAPDVWFAFDALPTLRLNPDADSAGGNQVRWLTVLGRPTDGANAAQVSAEVLAIAQRVADTDTRDQIRAQYVPVAEGHPEARQLGSAAALAMAAVGLVMLIACFNVAGLMLARSVERQQELGLRATLGASRGRLTRLLLTEGLVVATLAGGAALLLATWSEALLGGLSLPAPIPQRLHFTTDWRMVAFTGALVLVAAIVPTLTPLWRILRVDPMRWLKAGSTGTVGGLAPARARRTFIILQVAGSMVFLTLALMFVANFVTSVRTDPGFNTTHTAVMQISPSGFLITPERQQALMADLGDRLRARPDIAGVATADRLSFQLGAADTRRVSTDLRPCAGDACAPIRTAAVSADFFDVMGIPLRVGRVFTATDAESTAGVVINDAAAALLFPGATALGGWITDDRDDRPRQVIGVVATVISAQMAETPQPHIYRPFTGDTLAQPLTLVVRSHVDADAAVLAVRDTWRSLSDALPPAAVQTMDERMALPLWPSRVSAAFFATCGIVAVILVTVGLFGVTYHVVNRRTREFGVRLALGATPHDLRRLVLGESYRLVAPGLVVGLVLAVAAAHASGALLIGISPLDPRLYLAALATQALVTLLASWTPARRAARVSPSETMRVD